ncbi:MAG: F0F1 ATP synthase subunit delta [Verrucomicrobiota bacterium]|nr:F0F1 ATP synthase subunit delta [Verrucomicrobiota bacterium]
MKISKQARRDAKQLFRSCLVNGDLDENRARQVVEEVISQKPRGFMAILTQFQKLIKLEQDRRRATIESAAALALEFQTGLKNNLSKIYGSGLNIAFTENSSLLGGLRIQVGSDVYDGSVQARLNELKEAFET